MTVFSNLNKRPWSTHAKVVTRARMWVRNKLSSLFNAEKNKDLCVITQISLKIGTFPSEYEAMEMAIRIKKFLGVPPEKITLERQVVLASRLDCGHYQDTKYKKQ